jgi:hypothetical protein
MSAVLPDVIGLSVMQIAATDPLFDTEDTIDVACPPTVTDESVVGGEALKLTRTMTRLAASALPIPKLVNVLLVVNSCPSVDATYENSGGGFFPAAPIIIL